MKTNPILLLLPLLTLHAGEVPADRNLPYTDAAWFWTYDGYRQPLFDRNLSGHDITIGGRRFAHGICGHTCFSMVYDVNERADGFSAWAGVEDEDHPADIARKDTIIPSVNIVVLVDRREVFRREVKLGAAPIPVKIDLHGKFQLELRAEPGKGNTSHRFRVAFGDPVFLTEKSEALKKTLREEREKRDRVFAEITEYPPAPNWENIKIRKTAWGEYRNAYRVDNGLIECVFVPECGGRILYFAPKNGKNMLLNNQPHAGENVLKRGRAEDFGGGHFFRPLPRNYFIPTDPVLKFMSYEIFFPEDGVILMRSRPSAVFAIRYEYRYELRPHTSFMNVRNTIVNTAPFARPLGIWSIARLEVDNIKAVHVPNHLPESERNTQFENRFGLVKMFSGENGFQLSQLKDSQNPQHRVEFLCHSSPMELHAELKNGDEFNISYGAEKETASKSGIVHLYIANHLFEMEGHGQEQELNPGERISFAEKWEIRNKH